MPSDSGLVVLKQPAEKKSNRTINDRLPQLGMPLAQHGDQGAEAPHQLTSVTSILLNAPQFVGNALGVIPILWLIHQFLPIIYIEKSMRAMDAIRGY